MCITFIRLYIQIYFYYIIGLVADDVADEITNDAITVVDDIISQ